MKKTISMLLVVLFVFCFSVAFAEDNSCDHNWSGWTTVKEASCTADGTQRRICSECGTTEDKAISATGHSWSDWTTVKEATCEAAGTQRRICSECGKHEDKTISAPGHSWSGWTTVKEATCEAAGTQRRICSECGTTEDKAISAPGHSWSDWTTVKEATCTAAGTQRRICSECGTTEDKAIPAKGHTEVVDAAVEATCTKTGLTDGKHCSVCGEILKVQETIEALGHKAEKVEGKAATCTEAGLTDGEKCSVCGETLKAQMEVPVTGHDYYTVTYKPTTTSRGYDKHTCKVCGNEYSDNFKDKLPSPTPVPTQTPAPVIESLGEFGTIVFDVNGGGEHYSTEWETSDAVEDGEAENILVIIADPDEEGQYVLRELHLSFELIEQLKERNVDAISFVVGDAELMIPISMFDDEMLLVVKEDLEAPIGYVLTVDPNATNEAGESGCLVKIEIAAEDERFDVAEIATGMILHIADVEINVLESAVYDPIGNENNAE